VTATPLDQTLWSDSAKRHEQQLEGLRQDDERVAGVLEGLGPTNAQQTAQARAVRAEASDASAGRAMRRDDAQQQQSSKSGGSFRAALSSARGETIGPQAAIAADESTVTTPARPLSGTANSVTAELPVEKGNVAPQPAGDRPPSSGLAAVSAPPGISAATPQSTIPQSAFLAGMSAADLRVAAIPAQLAGAPTSAPTQLVENAPVAAASSASSGSTAAVAGASGAVGSDGAVDAANAQEPAAERDAGQSAPDADDRAENVERVLRVLRGSLARQRTTTVIRMDPPELGALRLELDLRKDVLTLRMSAATDAAQQLLREQLDVLRSGLEAAGIRLNQVEIVPLMPLGDASPFGTFAESGERRGESSRESGDRPVAQPGKPRVDGWSSGLRSESAPIAPVLLGPARLNVVA